MHVVAPTAVRAAPDAVGHESVDPRFAKIYAEQFGFVWRTLRALGVGPTAIEDTAQDVFIVVHRRLDRYDPALPIRGWLFGIARNVARTHRRRSSREDHLQLVDEPAAGDDAYGRRDMEALVLRCLAALGEDQREVFVLANLEGMTAPEIVEVLGIKLNTVYSRLRSARLEFERVLAQIEGADVGR